MLTDILPIATLKENLLQEHRIHWLPMRIHSQAVV